MEEAKLKLAESIHADQKKAHEEQVKASAERTAVMKDLSKTVKSLIENPLALADTECL